MVRMYMCHCVLDRRNKCDNVRLCPVQDRRRAHAMHILSIGDKRETQQNDLIRLLQPLTSHIYSQISQFALKHVTDLTDLTVLTVLTQLTECHEKGLI